MQHNDNPNSHFTDILSHIKDATTQQEQHACITVAGNSTTAEEAIDFLGYLGIWPDLGCQLIIRIQR